MGTKLLCAIAVELLASSLTGPAHAQLAHSETYTLIPVERAGARERTQLWRMQLGSWTLR